VRETTRRPARHLRDIGKPAVAFADRSLNQLRKVEYLVSTATARDTPTIVAIPSDSAEWIGREVRYPSDMDAVIDAGLEDRSGPRIGTIEE
jgi:hypothetical protein